MGEEAKAKACFLAFLLSSRGDVYNSFLTLLVFRYCSPLLKGMAGWMDGYSLFFTGLRKKERVEERVGGGYLAGRGFITYCISGVGSKYIPFFAEEEDER